MEIGDLKNVQETNTADVSVRNIRCPHCGRVGAFHGFPAAKDVRWIKVRADAAGKRIPESGFHAGVRICPNLECQSLVLVAFNQKTADSIVYPPELIDFDPAGIPAEVVVSFKEAISCHSVGSFRAAALMIRRTLEEVCGERGAEGNTLKDRLTALGGKIVLPKELLDAADELRLLGNDAAHIESKSYAAVSKQEVEISVRFAKELLKAAYQYKSLLEELRSLKKA